MLMFSKSILVPNSVSYLFGNKDGADGGVSAETLGNSLNVRWLVITETLLGMCYAHPAHSTHDFIYCINRASAFYIRIS